MKKQYVYIGQYYHIRNKELPVDYKFGVTTNLNQRERELSRTNSPIKYMIINAWEIPSNIIREKVENIIEYIGHSLFDRVQLRFFLKRLKQF